jgi:hypothetical protein
MSRHAYGLLPVLVPSCSVCRRHFGIPGWLSLFFLHLVKCNPHQCHWALHNVASVSDSLFTHDNIKSLMLSLLTDQSVEQSRLSVTISHSQLTSVAATHVARCTVSAPTSLNFLSWLPLQQYSCAFMSASQPSMHCERLQSCFPLPVVSTC